MFSILIPTFNNLEYLKICIKSIYKNSTFNHQIIVHVNMGSDGTIDFLKKNNITHTYTNYNAGICEGINMASKKVIKDFILYSIGFGIIQVIIYGSFAYIGYKYMKYKINLLINGTGNFIKNVINITMEDLRREALKDLEKRN